MMLHRHVSEFSFRHKNNISDDNAPLKLISINYLLRYGRFTLTGFLRVFFFIDKDKHLLTLHIYTIITIFVRITVSTHQNSTYEK